MLAKQRGKGAPKKKRTAEGVYFLVLFWLEGGKVFGVKQLIMWCIESKKSKGKKKPAPAASAA